MKCLNVIVFYDNQEEVQNYIQEVAEIGKEIVDICIVVNSDKNDCVPQMIENLNKKNIHNYKVVNYGENIGYLNPLLKTIQKIEISEYQYYILSNTDIHYLTKDFFRKLISKKYESDIACIAPSVFNTASSSYGNPHYLERTSKQKFQRLARIFAYPGIAKWYLRLAAIRASGTKKEELPSCYVYSPHGCYMIFTQDFITKIAGYEYGVKMYSEEACIGELVRKYGKKCFYDCEIKVEHQESTVTGKMDYKKRFLEWKKSIEYILETFY